jgi:hypothetical protein
MTDGSEIINGSRHELKLKAGAKALDFLTPERHG